jgi:hypothetical protein
MEQDLMVVSDNQIDGGREITMTNGSVYRIVSPEGEGLYYLEYGIFRAGQDEPVNKEEGAWLLDSVAHFWVTLNGPLPVNECLAFIQTHVENSTNIAYWDCSKVRGVDGKNFSSVVIPHLDKKGEVDHLSTIVVDWGNDKYYLFDTSGGGLHQSAYTQRPLKSQMAAVGVPEEYADKVIPLCIGKNSVQGRMSCAYWTAIFNEVIHEKGNISDIIQNDALLPHVFDDIAERVRSRVEHAKTMTNFVNRTGIEELRSRLSPQSQRRGLS